MVYKLFYTPLIRVSKTVVNNFLNLLINDFYNLITNFVVKEITVLKNVKFIPKLSSIYYVVSDASFTGCNKMLVANQNLILLLTITFRDIRGKLHRIFYTLGEFPKISLDKVFNINGLQKVFINKTILNKKGVYYNAYIKGQQPVVYCRYLLNEYITFYLIKENGIYFIIFNNFKLDVLSFFVYLGIPVSYVLKYLEDINFDKYKQLYYSDVLSNTCIVKKDSILVLIKAIQLNFSLDKKIWFNLYSAAYKTAFCLEIINICNFLTKIEFNKNSLTDLDSLSSKQVITINNYFLYYFKLHLNKHIKDINNDIKTILLDIETNKLNIDLKIKAKNYFTLKEHLTVNPHIQCLDTTNSLAELVQKNKISQSDSSLHNIAIRDVKLNNLGFISPIDTTEGINCGLTLSLTKNVRLSVDNKLEIPALNNKKNKSSLGCVFMTPCSLKKTSVILTNQVYRKNKCFSQERVSLFKTSFKTNNNRPNSFSVVNYKNIFSHSENLIPFLFYNDPTRVLMAARMQTQALPLVKKTPYFISTGEEKNVGFDNLRNLRSKHEGVVTYVSNNKVIIRDIYNRKHIYYLEKFRDNNYSIHNQSPIIWPGERVFIGQILVSTADSMESEFVVGNNVNVAYGNFFGYNFEDSIVVNKKVVYSNLFTSVKPNVYEVTLKKSTASNEVEVLGNSVVGQNLYSIRNIDKFGIIKEGVKISEGDVLISKFAVFNLDIKKLEYVFILLLCGNFVRFIKNRSLIVPGGGEGRVVKTEVFSSIDGYFYLKIRIYTIEHRILKIGDKLCGFYGNKGVISYIANNKDLIYTSHGLFPDLITDAVGIPSRMNLGQLFENLFGVNCVYYGTKLSFINSQPFLKRTLKSNIYNSSRNLSYLFGLKKLYNCYSPGKLFVKNGMTGYNLKEPAFLGTARYFKLLHMVQDKLHYRTIGPYTEIMQQPVKGRTNNGGQRFGEMEIWALQAYGNSYTIREILAYKSDDIRARNSVLSYYNNHNLEKVTISEGLNNLINEMQSMSLMLEACLSSKWISKKEVSINKVNLS